MHTGGDWQGYREEPLSDIRYLADSPNRSHLLRYLLDGPANHTELQEATGASRVTVSRITAGCRERGWIEMDDSDYRLTSLGERLIASFDELYATADSVQSLVPIWQWLPTGELDFDAIRLSDADLTLPHPSDPFQTVRTFANRVAKATRACVLASTLYNETLRATAASHMQWPLEYSDVSDAMEAEVEQLFEAVIAGDVLDNIRTDATILQELNDVLILDSVDIYRYDGDMPGYVVGVADDAALLHLFDSEGIPRALLESTDDRVVEWSLAQFETYLQDAEPVTELQTLQEY